MLDPTVRRSRVVVSAAMLLFTLTAVLFWPACNNGFTDYDDDENVTANPHVLNGFRSGCFAWALSSYEVMWHPLTWVSLQLDAELFGSGPVGFHRTNVLLHAANAAFLFLALHAMTGAMWRSFLVAALFAAHPLHVESVAWVTSRKDVLSGFFFMLSLLAYSHYAAAPNIRRYLCVVAGTALGLLAKPILVTLPCILLLLDYWPLGRLRLGEKNGGVLSNEVNKRSWQRLVGEKIPLLALAVGTALVTVFAQQRNGAAKAIVQDSIFERLGNALVSYVAYLRQTCWPVDLAVFYPHPHDELPALQVACAVLLLATLSGLAIWQATRRPYLLVGWLWFLGMLVPVLGLIQNGEFARADRYVYLPHIGLFIAVVWTASEFAEAFRHGTAILTVLATAAVAGCAVMTSLQIHVWRDTRTLWEHALAVTANNHYAHEHLAKVAWVEGNKAEAVAHIGQAVRIRPGFELGPLVLAANWLTEQGEYELAVQTLTKVLRSHPAAADVYWQRGKVLDAQGNWELATADFLEATRLDPAVATYKYYLAHALSHAGRAAEAQPVYAAAVRIAPQWPQQAARAAWQFATHPDASVRLGIRAVQLAELALGPSPGLAPDKLDILAAAYAECGRFSDAVVVAQQALSQASARGDMLLAEALRARIKLYESGSPYREAPVLPQSIRH